MHKSKFIVVLLAVVLAFGAAPAAFAQDGESFSEEPVCQEPLGLSVVEDNSQDTVIPEVPQEQLGGESSFAPGEIIVVFTDNNALEEKIEILEHELDEYAELAAEQVNGGQILALSASPLEKTAVEQLDDGTSTSPLGLVVIPEELTIAQAVAIAENAPGVAAAQPNYLYYLTDDEFDPLAFVNDPEALNQSGKQWHLYTTGAIDAWSNPNLAALSTSLSDTSPTVAVLDSGVNLSHPDLAANLDTLHAWDVVNDCSLSATIASSGGTMNGDINGHGTMVSGFISAVANNGVSVAGITNNRVRVLPINIFEYVTNGSGGTTMTATTESVVQAIELVVDYKTSGILPNLCAMNMSIGGYYDDENGKKLDEDYDTMVAYDAVMHDCIVAARTEGILTIAAAGNEGNSAAYKNAEGQNCFSAPSDYHEVVSVTSTDINEKRAATSAYNQYKDIAAPGYSVASTYYRGGHSSGGGTSYACPMVAGAVALLYALDPDLTPDEIVQLLYGTSMDLGATGWDPYFGWGRLNVWAAVAELTQMSHVDISASSLGSINASYTYTGSAIVPIPTVIVSDMLLVKDRDYTVEYSNNINLGTATVIVTGTGNYTGRASTTFAIVNQLPPAPTWVQVAGYDLYDTMASIASEGWSAGGVWQTGGTVIVSIGTNFPDALSAAGLAGFEGDAPIILTDPMSLSPQAAATLQSLAPARVLVVGGPAALKEEVLASIRATAPGAAIERIWGTYSMDTARMMYAYGKDKSAASWGRTAIIARGDDFADALSVAPYAYANTYPIFQVAGPQAALDSDTLAAINATDFDKVILVGGTGALSAQVEDQLRAAGITDIERWWGQSAYDTSMRIATNSGLSFNNMAVATGRNFPDALAGAALCGKQRAVLCLVDDTQEGNVCIDGVIRPNKDSIAQGYFFGGDAVVTPATQARIRAVWS